MVVAMLLNTNSYLSFTQVLHGAYICGRLAHLDWRCSYTDVTF